MPYLDVISISLLKWLSLTKSSYYSSCRTKVRISKVLPHENFRPTANDIALLKLGISSHMMFFAAIRLQAVILLHLML